MQVKVLIQDTEDEGDQVSLGRLARRHGGYEAGHRGRFSCRAEVVPGVPAKAVVQADPARTRIVRDENYRPGRAPGARGRGLAGGAPWPGG